MGIIASPRVDAPAWPPQSPFQALLSSPSGRRKWQDKRDRSPDRSPSPSPMRKAISSSKVLQALSAGPNLSDDNDEEDEETIQLELQAIEARLKLKRLQSKSKKGSSNAESGKDADQHVSKRQKVTTEVQIPVSPTRERVAPTVHRSPARVLLGIDKGLKGSQVSLKRARTSPHASRSKDVGSADSAVPEKKSFSQRLAESRTSEQDRRLKEDKLQSVRSTGFARPQQHSHRAEQIQSGNQKKHVNANPPTSTHPSRSTINHAKDVDEPTPTASTNNDTTSAKEPAFFEPHSSLHLSKRHIDHPSLLPMLEDKEIYTLPRLLKEVHAPHYDPPACEKDFVVFGILASKTKPHETKSSHHTSAPSDDSLDPNKFMVLKLTDLDWEIDLFLFSTAFTQYWKLTPGTVLAILNPDIMPPKVQRDSGKFSLKLTSSEDQIIEIGVARDLGFCKSIKKDGNPCESWINVRKTEYCDYHVNLIVERTRPGRMEVNGIARKSRGGGTHSSGANTSRSWSNRNTSQSTQNTGGRQKDPDTGEFYYSAGSSQPYSSHSNTLNLKNTTKQIMDAEDLAKPERMRKRLETKERERILAAKLGEIGNGIGATYLRATTATDKISDKDENGNGKTDTRQEKNAKELGLVGVRGHVRLSPAKRKYDSLDSSTSFKRQSGDSRPTVLDDAAARPTNQSSTSDDTRTERTNRARHTANAIGWGGAFQRGLLDRKKVVGTSRARNTKPKEVLPSISVSSNSVSSAVVAGANTSALGTATTQGHASMALSTETCGDARSMRSSSPVKKRARFAL